MKKLFKHIIRKVDEKVANKINRVNECINTVSDKMNNKEDALNLAIISTTAGVGCIGLGVAILTFSACMFMKYKIM